MNYFKKLSEITEEHFQRYGDGVMNKEYEHMFELLDLIDNKMNMYERIKFCGPLKVRITENIHMGHAEDSDILEFVSSEYLFVSSEGEVYIREDINVIAVFVESNQWVELKFEDGKSSCDIACDEVKDYDKYLELA